MLTSQVENPLEVLLIEDNPGDVRLTEEAFKEASIVCNLHVTMDGVDAMDFLCNRGRFEEAPQPDFILLDLNLPRKDGRQVLKEIKGHPSLRHIPVVILSTSQSEEDIFQSYNLQANCYISKPVDIDRFIEIIKSIKRFWFDIAILPGRKPKDSAVSFP